MGKIVSNFFMSLDGVVESPDKWHFPYFNEEMGAAIGRGMETNHAFLMGRVLYEEWAAFWPDKGDDEPFAGFINNVPSTSSPTRSGLRPGTTRRSSPATSRSNSRRSRTRRTVTS